MPSGRLKKGTPPPGRTATCSTRITEQAGEILRVEAAKPNGLSGIKFASAAIVEKYNREKK